MKHRNLFLAILVIVVATAVSVAVVSCKKDTKKQETIESTNEMPTYGNMDEYLISFKNRLLSAQKGEELVSLEQAQNDLCNLLNFDFGDANFPFNVLQRDTLYVKLTLSNDGQVDLSQLALTYKDAADKVSKTYNNVDLPEKTVYLILCTFNDKEAKNDEIEGQIVLLTRGVIPPEYKTSFDETDNWRLDSLRGKCNGTCIGDDHLTMLTLVYYNTKGLINCTSGHVYFTNPRYAWFEAREFQEFSPSGPSYGLGYRMWCGYKSWIPNYCVGYMEMNYYLNNLHDILVNGLFIYDDEWVTDIALSLVDFGDPNAWGGLKSNFRCDFHYATINCTGGGGGGNDY